MEECAGRVVLGMMVRALRVYAPLCIKVNTLTMFAAAIASGRRPSKLIINTRSLLGRGTGVIVGVDVSVGGGGVMVGVLVDVKVGAIVGVAVETDDPQASKKTRRTINP